MLNGVIKKKLTLLVKRFGVFAPVALFLLRVGDRCNQAFDSSALGRLISYLPAESVKLQLKLAPVLIVDNNVATLNFRLLLSEPLLPTPELPVLFLQLWHAELVQRRLAQRLVRQEYRLMTLRPN